MKMTIVLLTLLLAGCSRDRLTTTQVSLDDLRIEVFGDSRELGYTNKEAGFFYTETSAEHQSGWQGWHVMSKKILDDYLLSVDGKPLRKSDVHLSIVLPHQFTRAYRAGVQETVTLLDSVNALVIELAKIKGDSVSIQPLAGDFIRSEDFLVRPIADGILIARKNHLHRDSKEDYPVWIGMGFADRPVGTGETALRDGRLFSPAFARTGVRDGKAVAVMVAGDTEDQTTELLKSVKSEYRRLISDRKARMERILNRAFVRTNDERFDKALSWAILSADALIMNQGGKKGIFAGLPWFSNYWGRDSFISLPGATLVTGDFSDAKEILRSFARWQDEDRRSPTCGRIPNLVTPSSVSYNTADGTPWFVIALGDYATMSGDTAFVRELYPVVTRTIQGALARCDINGLLTHGDAETWMDAAGPDGPWSPRGNRANDIQALWYKQLLTASWMAERLGDSRKFTEWFSYAEQVRRSFNRLFVDTGAGIIVDHLLKDGTPNRQLRPNQLLTLDIVDNRKVQFDAFRSVTESLVYPYGVASLSQDDPNFHPYHHYAPYYVQDAAYHNGVVWTWLAGPWISAATKLGYAPLASRVTENMIHQILDRGGVGTLSELLDASPRNGETEPRLSGTFSQAWSLAEFIRVAYQDYLGVSVDASEKKIELHPSLLPSMTDAVFNIPFGSQTIAARYHNAPSEGTIFLASPEDAPSIDVVVTWRLPTGTEQNFAYVLAPGSRATLTITPDKVSVDDALGVRVTKMNVRRDFRDETALHPLHLATPLVRDDLKALRKPSYRLLRNEEIKVDASGARLLLDRSDPEGDDRGNGSYVYPLTPSLKPGSLDITRFKVSADDRNLYFQLAFKNLSDPGWHPEYGFQLTFAAIAIDKDGLVGSGRTAVGRNAQFSLPKRDACETIIFVGGGLRVEDAAERVLAEYVPAAGDEKNPLGTIGTRTISFSLPVDIVGTPAANWRYTVLIGAQDDHGGAGIGDFRSVEATAHEWTGGGKKRNRDSNIYDVINP